MGSLVGSALLGPALRFRPIMSVPYVRPRALTIRVMRRSIGLYLLDAPHLRRGQIARNLVYSAVARGSPCLCGLPLVVYVERSLPGIRLPRALLRHLAD